MQEYEVGKCLKSYKMGIKKYQLFPCLAEVGLEHRECSIPKNMGCVCCAGGVWQRVTCHIRAWCCFEEPLPWRAPFLASGKDGGRA